MSLYLPEQKVGSHSTEGGSSNKFVLKGRQTGSMHRGHTWVFRAESHDTMMAWYEDIKALTEKSPEERSQFVRGHVRSLSRSSQRSISSDGMVDDVDEEPFVSEENAAAVVATPGSRQDSFGRPAPGGRFPSDLQVNAQRGMQVPLSPSSQSSERYFDNSEYAMRGGLGQNGNTASDYETVAAAGALPGSGIGDGYPGNRASQLMVGQNYGSTASVRNMDTAPSHAAIIHDQARQDGINPYNGEPVGAQRNSSQHYSSVPIVVAGNQANQTQNRDYGHDSANASSYHDPGVISSHQDFGNGASHRDVNGEATYAPQTAAVDYSAPTTAPIHKSNTAGNGYAAHEYSANGSGSYPSNEYARPAGRRTDSTPHVPGEYPRNLPITPGI
jgi:hypothetical protein